MSEDRTLTVLASCVARFDWVCSRSFAPVSSARAGAFGDIAVRGDEHWPHRAGLINRTSAAATARILNRRLRMNFPTGSTRRRHAKCNSYRRITLNWSRTRRLHELRWWHSGIMENLRMCTVTVRRAAWMGLLLALLSKPGARPHHSDRGGAVMRPRATVPAAVVYFQARSAGPATLPSAGPRGSTGQSLCA